MDDDDDDDDDENLGAEECGYKCEEDDFAEDGPCSSSPLSTESTESSVVDEDRASHNLMFSDVEIEEEEEDDDMLLCFESETDTKNEE